VSWLFSRALVEASSVDTSSDGAPSVPLSGTDTPQAFSWLDRTTAASRRSRSGMTCKPLTDDRGAAVLTSCLEASLARTSQPPGREQGSTESEAACGDTWRESSVRFDRASSSWRTHRCLWDEVLPESSVTLPRSGMMRGGVLYQRRTQELPTDESGSGSWHRIPTPTVGDSKSSGSRNTEASKAHPGTSLTDFVRQDGGRGRIPTPAATDWKGSAKEGQRRGQLTDPAMGVVPAGGKLNPTWVEWLMGWPLGWTDCDASATGRFREWCASHGARW
jgi:hypothetical protein